MWYYCIILVFICTRASSEDEDGFSKAVNLIAKVEDALQTVSVRLNNRTYDQTIYASVSLLLEAKPKLEALMHSLKGETFDADGNNHVMKNFRRIVTKALNRLLNKVNDAINIIEYPRPEQKMSERAGQSPVYQQVNQYSSFPTLRQTPGGLPFNLPPPVAQIPGYSPGSSNLGYSPVSQIPGYPPIDQNWGYPPIGWGSGYPPVGQNPGYTSVGQNPGYPPVGQHLGWYSPEISVPGNLPLGQGWGYPPVSQSSRYPPVGQSPRYPPVSVGPGSLLPTQNPRYQPISHNRGPFSVGRNSGYQPVDQYLRNSQILQSKGYLAGSNSPEYQPIVSDPSVWPLPSSTRRIMQSPIIENTMPSLIQYPGYAPVGHYLGYPPENEISGILPLGQSWGYPPVSQSPRYSPIRVGPGSLPPSRNPEYQPYPGYAPVSQNPQYQSVGQNQRFQPVGQHLGYPPESEVSGNHPLGHSWGYPPVSQSPRYRLVSQSTRYPQFGQSPRYPPISEGPGLLPPSRNQGYHQPISYNPGNFPVGKNWGYPPVNQYVGNSQIYQSKGFSPDSKIPVYQPFVSYQSFNPLPSSARLLTQLRLIEDLLNSQVRPELWFHQGFLDWVYSSFVKALGLLTEGKPLMHPAVVNQNPRNQGNLPASQMLSQRPKGANPSYKPVIKEIVHGTRKISRLSTSQSKIGTLGTYSETHHKNASLRSHMMGS